MEAWRPPLLSFTRKGGRKGKEEGKRRNEDIEREEGRKLKRKTKKRRGGGVGLCYISSNLETMKACKGLRIDKKEFVHLK